MYSTFEITTLSLKHYIAEEHDQDHGEDGGHHQSNQDYLDMTSIIDTQLNRYDVNEDGIVTYAEFKSRTQKS